MPSVPIVVRSVSTARTWRRRAGFGRYYRDNDPPSHYRHGAAWNQSTDSVSTPLGKIRRWSGVSLCCGGGAGCGGLGRPIPSTAGPGRGGDGESSGVVCTARGAEVIRGGQLSHCTIHPHFTVCIVCTTVQTLTTGKCGKRPGDR